MTWYLGTGKTLPLPFIVYGRDHVAGYSYNGPVRNSAAFSWGHLETRPVLMVIEIQVAVVWVVTLRCDVVGYDVSEDEVKVKTAWSSETLLYYHISN
jgi:hypothetical protein